MNPVIQRDQAEFLYQQVVRLIRQLQQQQVLRIGERLPSLRQLSQQLGVSIPTVRQGYEELERLGVIEARDRSGYYLKAESQPSCRPGRLPLNSEPVPVRQQTLLEQFYQAVHQPGILPLGIAQPSMAHPSEKALLRTMRRVTTLAGHQVMHYGPIDGFAPLKRQLAFRYLDVGLSLQPDELIITNGGQEALAIALQAVAKAGDVIAVESPTYFGVLELIETLGMMAVEIPVCPDDGIWLDDLQHVLETQPIRACVFSSSISNPMGSFMPDTQREQLVTLLEQRDIPLIEDDVYGELYFGVQRGRPAQCFSRKGLVLTCSSFSKTVAPSYRVGWLLPGRFGTEVWRLKRALSFSSSLLNQWTMSEFIVSGDYDRNLKKLRQALRLNKDRMMALVQQHFPVGTKVSHPQGGAVLWIELAETVDCNHLFQQALHQQISIAPGSLFSPSQKFTNCFRLSFGVRWQPEVEQAIQTLGQLVVVAP
ncbi:aminotransferase-like domain-containing protein [Alkalimonas collagenimarina]|uniref:aminotransferase-like domain-containing protein n=1 Tax=Alkalimonas collagenimarina TaxID=400390 RepID=UPI00350F91E5